MDLVFDNYVCPTEAVFPIEPFLLTSETTVHPENDLPSESDATVTHHNTPRSASPLDLPPDLPPENPSPLTLAQDVCPAFDVSSGLDHSAIEGTQVQREYELFNRMNAPGNRNESTKASGHILHGCGNEVGQKKDYNMNMPELDYTPLSTKRPAEEDLGEDEQPAPKRVHLERPSMMMDAGYTLVPAPRLEPSARNTTSGLLPLLPAPAAASLPGVSLLNMNSGLLPMPPPAAANPSQHLANPSSMLTSRGSRYRVSKNDLNRLSLGHLRSVNLSYFRPPILLRIVPSSTN